MDTEKTKELSAHIAETLDGYLNDNEGWTVAKKTKEITVEYKHSSFEGFTGHLYRGQMEYKCPKEVVYKYLDPIADGGSLRRKWDKDIREFKILKQVDRNLWIIQTMTNSAALGMISPRDFVDLVLHMTTDDCLSTNAVSVEYPDCPHQAKYVRGWNYPSGNVCLTVPGNPDHSRVVTFVQPDIKGMLPRSLVDSAIPTSMMGFFNNLKDILKKDGCLKS
ncbi:stAR-related lipid transfer protein 5 [Aplysia californica]|uniref:StAR-related lipid transfer protein 5 n=1 Tax=Aplysia californica TaxID=6500 RepID=A0ABM0K4J4_APLCA|nr:stAR-related lipid transfer protein 5 [Aplysia californica]